MAYIQRVELGKQLPLKSPFALHIFPSFYCNFKCNYCLHSLSQEELNKKGFCRQMMEFSVYQKAIDDATQFGQKLKTIIFAGHGEPLMHQKIVEMVAYAEQKGVAERTEIVTNASLLTNELSDGLIDAGLTRLRISIQGTTPEKYQETCGVSLDFDAFVERIRYFYQHKKSTEVYIKIIDCALENEKDEERFKQIFSPIADTVAIEHEIPFVKEVDYSHMELSGLCKQGNHMNSSICSMPFYMMVLYPDGRICPCCSTDVPCSFGNVKNTSLLEIWNSPQRAAFLRRQLDGVQHIPVCQQCCVPAYGLQPGDYLDQYVNDLKLKY